MLVSRCCQNVMYVEGYHIHYYVCNKCKKACDPLEISFEKGDRHDCKDEGKSERIIGQT
jgi:hypothetical protein